MGNKSNYETYLAKADAGTARALAATESPFTIEVRFLGGLTEPQKNAFKTAADRWTKVIVGDVPSVMVDSEVIDDVLILAQGKAIDGVGKILGQAGPTHLRPAAAGNAAFLPAKGIMSFDTADLQKMEQNGTLNDVITHEMGHVLGIGTIWDEKGLLKGAGTSNPTFGGKTAIKEYRKLPRRRRGFAACAAREHGRPRHGGFSLAGDHLPERTHVGIHRRPWQPTQPRDGRQFAGHRLHSEPRRLRALRPAKPRRACRERPAGGAYRTNQRRNGAADHPYRFAERQPPVTRKVKQDRIAPSEPSAESVASAAAQAEGFVRPEAAVLAEKALVPARNLIAPAPNQFTHELIRTQPYYFAGAQPGMAPDGEFAAGTKVVLLLHDGGATCRVADDRGLYVETEYGSLRKLRQRT